MLSRPYVGLNNIVIPLNSGTHAVLMVQIEPVFWAVGAVIPLRSLSALVSTLCINRSVLVVKTSYLYNTQVKFHTAILISSVFFPRLFCLRGSVNFYLISTVKAYKPYI